MPAAVKRFAYPLFIMGIPFLFSLSEYNAYASTSSRERSNRLAQECRLRGNTPHERGSLRSPRDNRTVPHAPPYARCATHETPGSFSRFRRKAWCAHRPPPPVIGARTHDAFGTHHAIRQARKASARKRVSTPSCLATRVNWGAHVGFTSMLHLLGLQHDVAQKRFVFLNLEARFLDELAATHRNEEEKYSGRSRRFAPRNRSHRSISSRFQSTTVVCSWNGSPPACTLRCPSWSGRTHWFKTAESVVLGGVEAVNRNAHCACAAFLQAHGDSPR